MVSSSVGFASVLSSVATISKGFRVAILDLDITDRIAAGLELRLQRKFSSSSESAVTRTSY